MSSSTSDLSFAAQEEIRVLRQQAAKGAITGSQLFAKMEEVRKRDRDMKMMKPMFGGVRIRVRVCTCGVHLHGSATYEESAVCSVCVPVYCMCVCMCGYCFLYGVVLLTFFYIHR